MSDNNFYQRMTDAVVNGEVAEAARIAQETLDAGLNALDVIKKGVVGGTDKLGDLFQDFEIFLPELIMGGDAAKAAMALLVPHIPIAENYQAPGKIVMGTVFGDIVTSGEAERGIMVCGTGVGASIAANKMKGIRAAVCHDVHSAHQSVEHDDVNVMCIGAKIIGLSALMSTSLYYQQDVINYLNDAGLRHKYYVIVGGGPVTPDWIRKIGADGGGKQANNVVEVCKQLAFHEKHPPFDEPLVIW
ncbi:MAG: RpiB/LacA/LacB family sugar-phosphate isomerase [Chloroflexi bacterium]|nr:RpiB/LacA/LacB family sugar-phosphate isomerase [Chloroflexota bacterium]